MKTPNPQGVCPCCNGSGLRELAPEETKYSWNKNKTHGPCRNCGGQYMYTTPTGQVNLNKQGIPCKHSYVGSDGGRCRTWYTCTHCGDEYEIDSSD